MRKYWLLSILAAYFLMCHACYGVILLDETWADGTRDDTNLPDESATWISDSSLLSLSAGNFAFTQDSSSNRMWTYFAADGSPATMNIGDQLKATIRFTPTGLHDNSSKSFRLCLGADPTSPQVNEDTNDDGGGDGDPWADVRAYGAMVPLSNGATKSSDASVGKHTTFTGSGLMGSTGDWTMTSGGDDIVVTSGQELTLTLVLDYVAEDQMDVIFTLANAGGEISTHTYTDTADIATKFDMLYFRFSKAVETADVLDFHELKVEHIPSAESLTWASNPDPANGETDVAIDLSDRIIPNNLSWTAPIDPNIWEIKGYDLYLDPNDVKVSGRDSGCRIAANIIGDVNQYDPSSDFNYNEKLYWVVDTRYTRDDDPNLGTPNETIYVGSPYPWSFTTITASPVIETYNSVVTTLDLLPAALSAVVTDGDNNVSSAAFSVTSSPVGSSYVLTENVSDPYAPSATLDPNMPGTYEVKLTVTDASANTTEATAQVVVYDNACEAAQAAAGWQGFNAADLNTDCDVNLQDLATFAAGWLDDRNLKAQGIPAP